MAQPRQQKADAQELVRVGGLRGGGRAIRDLRSREGPRTFDSDRYRREGRPSGGNDAAIERRDDGRRHNTMSIEEGPRDLRGLPLDHMEELR